MTDAEFITKEEAIQHIEDLVDIIDQRDHHREG